MTTKARRLREQTKRDREAAVGDYLDSQRRRRQYEHNHGWPLQGILRGREVFEVPVAGGVIRVTRVCVGLR